MGGRGSVSFSARTASRERALGGEIESLSARIDEIDARAQAAHDAVMRDYAGIHVESLLESMADEARISVLENSERGQLVDRRKKLRAELRRIEGGQLSWL